MLGVVNFDVLAAVATITVVDMLRCTYIMCAFVRARAVGWVSVVYNRDCVLVLHVLNVRYS